VRSWRSSANGTLVLPGEMFPDIVEAAENTPGTRHLLVIEEINRGNLAQIFRDMLTLLQADKRDPAGALTLTYATRGTSRCTSQPISMSSARADHPKNSAVGQVWW
jgi:5-methylcytosine-specific restriction protein B